MAKYLMMFMLLSSAASGQVGLFINFTQWGGMSAEGRTAYIMGAFDTMQIVAPNESAKKLAVLRHACMARADLSAVQFAENVKAFAKRHPDLQDGPVQAVLIAYLDDLCGPIAR
jgi:hypothetical protein